jgi:hypothetical protein
MAQKVQVVLLDDIDGGSADETLKFSFEGASYEIDLSTAHAAELRASVAPWLKAARKVSGRTSGRAVANSDTSKIRAWAKSTGLGVSERGRISAEIRAAYTAAH